MRVSFFAFFIVLACATAGSAASAQTATTTKPLMFAWQLGGSPFPGQVKHYVDGERIHPSDERWTRPDRGLLLAFDTRALAIWNASPWLMLAAQAGLTNWNSGYLRKAGHDRSTFFSLAVAPALRKQFRQCRRCPSVFVGPRGGYVLSYLDGRQPYGSVKPKPGAGQGWLVGGSIGLDVPVANRVALRFELGVEHARFRHHMDYGDLGREDFDTRITRGFVLLGAVWAP